MEQENSRPDLIRQIQKDPSLVTRQSKLDGRWWGRLLVTVVVSTTSAMSLFLAIEVAKIWSSNQDCRKNVYLPLWLGINWPSQRKWVGTAYSAHVDSGPLNAVDLDAIRGSVPSRVLDCLFRSPVVRETYGIPLKVAPSSADDFEVWVEPQYPTVHGLKVAVSKSEGKLHVSFGWSIKSLSWDIVDCIRGTLWRFGGLVSPDPTPHDYGGGQIHEIHSDTKTRSRSPDFKVMFRGHVGITSRDHSGVALYTGTVDAAHPDLNHGARILSVDLKMSEGGQLILYKVFDDTNS